jgi:hypothetical protein
VNNVAPTEPALWVLASMALMLLVGALFLTGGFLAGLAVLSASPTPTADASNATTPWPLDAEPLDAELSAPASAPRAQASGQDVLRPKP